MQKNSVSGGLSDLITRRLGLSARPALQDPLVATVAKLLSANGGNEPQLLEMLDGQSIESDEWQMLIAALTVGETRFMRHRSWFEQIRQTVLAPLVSRRLISGTRRLRIWCAGCSTGEEAYTVAMLLFGLIPNPSAWDIDILATDIRREAVLAGKAGKYGTLQLREVDIAEANRFFGSAGRGRHAVASELRKVVRFEVGNLADTGGENRHYDAVPYDLVICRNVIMYLVPDVQRNVVRRLCDALHDNGWIVVSPAESTADWFKPLQPVNAGDAILFSKASAVVRQSPEKKRSKGSEENVARPRELTKAPRLQHRKPAASVLQTNPAELDLERIRRFADAGRLREAEVQCRQKIEGDSLNGEASLLLAAVLLELGDNAGALETARRAVYLMPSSAPALNLLGGALLKLGHLDRARRTFVAAERLAAKTATDIPTGEILGTKADGASREVSHAGRF